MNILPRNISNSRLFLKLAPVTLTLLIGCIFYSTISSLFARWIKWDESLSHGLIVIGLFLFLQFKSSPWLPTHTNNFLYATSLILLALASASWFLFHIVNLYIFEQLVLLPILFLAIASVFGWGTSLKNIQLILLPIFAIPIWDQLSSTLVNMSSFVVGKMVQAISMPAIIDGNSIFIPYGHIVIADGCSGLRYLVIALTLGYTISYLNRYNIAKLLLVLCIAVAIGLFANWLRIFILVVVGYQTQMQSSLMSDHEYFGWLLFALISFPAIYLAPVVRTAVVDEAPSLTTKKPQIFLPIIALAIGPILAQAIDLQPQIIAPKDLLNHELQPILPQRMPVAVAAPESSRSENAVTTNQVFIQVDQYQRTKVTDKLVPYITRLYDNHTWTPQSHSSITVRDKKAVYTLFKHKNSQKLVAQVQWFGIADTITDSIAVAKVLQIPALLSNQNHFMIVTLQSECDMSNCEKIKLQLQEVANSTVLNK